MLSAIRCAVVLRTRALIGDDVLHMILAALGSNMAVPNKPTAVAYHAVQRSEVEVGTFVVVFGAGPIGLLITQLLIRIHACRVLVVDLDEWRVGVAAAIGALVGGPEDDLLARVSAETSGDMAARVFEATGNPDCTLKSAQVVAIGGRIILIGWNQRPALFDTITFMRKEADLVARRHSVGAFPAVLELLGARVIDDQQLITHRYDLADAPGAFKLLDSAAHTLKVVIAS